MNLVDRIDEEFVEILIPILSKSGAPPSEVLISQLRLAFLAGMASFPSILMEMVEGEHKDDDCILSLSEAVVAAMNKKVAINVVKLGKTEALHEKGRPSVN